jgi:hypothetical protein
MMKINKGFLELILTLLNGVFRQYPAALIDLAKIQSVKYYVKGVVVAREFLIVGVQLGCSLIFVMTGLILLHTGALLVLFLVLKWSLATKLTVVFLLGILELAGALAFMKSLFSDRKWMKVTKADLLTARLLK